MSPSLLAALQRLARQTRCDVTACNVDLRSIRSQAPPFTVRDFYRPYELVRRNPRWATL